MKKTTLKKIIRSRTLKRTLSALVAVFLFFGALPMTEIGEKLSEYSLVRPVVHAEDEEVESVEGDDPKYKNGEITLTLDKFSEYSRYARMYHKFHQNDIITIGASSSTESGTTINITNFYSLGTAKYPFNGQIKIATGIDVTLTLDAPLFNYVYDSVKLNYGDVLKVSRWYPSSATASDKAVPLLANNVIHDDTNSSVVTWKVNVTKPSNADQEGTVLHEFGGFIGAMRKNHTAGAESSPACTGSAKLKVEATMSQTGSTEIAMHGVNDLGMVCGTMEAGTDLDFKLTTDMKITGISTSNGNVGGLVGSMQTGAKLTYNGPDDVQYVANTSGTAANDSNNIRGGIITTDDNGYAGGVVGKNNQGTVVISTTTGDSATPYPIKQTIIGKKGAGGVYGYYKPASDVAEIKTDIYDINCVLKGKGDNGGFIGMLDSNKNLTVNVKKLGSKSNFKVVSKHLEGDASSGTYGGLIGTYKVDSKAHSLTVKGVASTVSVSADNPGGSQYFGGGIGRIDKSTTSYVKFDTFTVDNAANADNLTFGGLVASADNSFIDAENVCVKVSGYYKGGGLVGSLKKGVLRMSGATDLTNAKPSSPGGGEETKVGQIVGYRDDALIFAQSDWNFTRCVPETDNKIEVDDIGGWGEVIRLSSSKLTGLFTVDETKHEVTVNNPSTSYTEIGSVLDFAKTALCFQIAENDYIKFENTTQTWSSIKSENIIIESDIDLSGTGITGLTRDNDVGSTEKKYEYSGTIQTQSGVANKTITLAVGEEYGTPGEGVTQGKGRIYRHKYNGLIGFADGAAVKDLIIAGNINISAMTAMYAGAAAACAKGDFTSTGVKVTASFTFGGSNDLKLGGILGEATSDIGKISITGISGQNTVECNIIGSNSGASTNIGGIIGRIDYTGTGPSDLTDSAPYWCKFTNVKVNGTIKNGATTEHAKIGGLVATIASCSSNSHDASDSKRTLGLSGVKVDGLSIEASRSNEKPTKSLGGLLGYSWLNVNTDFAGVSVTGSSLKLKNVKANYGDMAGLVYEGTGHWTVADANAVTINNITVSADNAKTSFGMFVNKAWNGKPSENGSSALFLELKNTDAYKITNVGESNIPQFAVYDELAAYSAYYEQDNDTRRTAPSGDTDNPYILQNGAAIISIKTDVTKGLNMDNDTASHSYTPQTGRGSAMNPNTRYYYNLDRLSGTSPTDDTNPARLMRWGLRQYAHSSIKNCFTNGGNFTDSIIPAVASDDAYDMQGYSWYPVDIDSSVTVNGIFKLYNKEFEGSEAKTVTGHTTRSSLVPTQHYLLHNGLFRNVNSGQTLTIGTVTLQGNVGLFRTYASTSSDPKYGSGALICGRVQGAQDNKATVKVNGTIELDRVYVHDIKVNGTFVDYAPLAINKVGDHTQLTISALTKVDLIYDEENDEDIPVCYFTIPDDQSSYPGISLEGTDTKYPKAGTSLIGDVGLTATPVGIILDFSSMVLDGRTADITANNSNFDNVYGTKRSIFTKSTLLNSFKYESGSFGKYNFTWDEDWKRANTNYPYPHKVTYGKELGYTSSNSGSGSEYPDKELWYSGEDHTANVGRFTNPSTRADKTGTYSQHFIDDFLPYVAAGYNKANKLHQIMVNQTTADFSGCGTYNDPYIINTGAQLGSVSKVLNNPSQSGFKLNIPNKKTNNVLKPDTTATWHNKDCGDTSYHYLAASTVTTSSTDPDTGEVTETTVSYPAGYYKDGVYVTATEGTDSDDYLTPKTVQTYLAGAYFKIGNVEKLTIETNDGFEGLGYSGADLANNQHAIFRGVFIGDNRPIINKTAYPLIATSNGCVVKDLNLTVSCASDIEISGTSSAFTTSGKNAYGGLIGKIFGGDTIIDNVLVDYSVFTKKIVAKDGKAQLAPIGGYIGVVVNGGVIFRNMTNRANALTTAGLTNDKVSAASGSYPSGVSNSSMLSDDPYGGWLYVNPIIGRVINGFAVTESTAYRPFENGVREYGDGTKVYYTETKDSSGNITSSYNGTDANKIGVTLKNGTKHYSITDINKGLTQLDTSTSKDIKVPNAQAFFVMSVMVNSGMRSNVLGYKQSYQVTRWADYTDVATNLTAVNTSVADYNNYAKNDRLNKTTYSEQAGYLAKFYTTNVGNRGNITDKITLTGTDIYYLPDGYKGIGNMYNANSTIIDSLRLSLNNFIGNGATISQNSSYYYYYSKNNTNAISKTNTNENDYKNSEFDNGYKHIGEVGFGLFNYQKGATESDSKKYYNFTMTGNVICDCIDNKSGNHIPYLCDMTNAGTSAGNGIDRSEMVSAGMLMGTTINTQYIDSVAVNNINVKGVKNAGGLVGFNPVTGKKITYRNTLSTASDKIKVHGGASVGGMIGRSYQSDIEIDNNNATYNITEVVSDCDYRSGVDYNYGVGGFIGNARTAKANTNYVKIKNVTVGIKDSDTATTVKCNEDCINGIMTGGLAGILNNAPFTVENCKVYNQSVTSPYTCGGLIGYITSTAGKSEIKNIEVYAKSGTTAIVKSTGTYGTTKENQDSHVASGGFIGATKMDLRANVEIKNSSIDGYNIEAEEVSGGFIGIIGQRPTSAGDNYPYTISAENIKVSNCSVTALLTSSKYNCAGGLIGAHYCPSDKQSNRNFYGYNILVKNLSFSGTNQGYICGWRNNDSKCFIKLAGFSRQDDRQGGNNKMIKSLVGSYPTKSAANTSPTSDNLYGTGGYVIFADYKDIASSASNGKLFPTINNGNNVNTMRKATVVTVNTKITDTDNQTTVSEKTEPEKMIYGDYDSTIGNGKKTVVTVVETYYDSGWKQKTTITTNETAANSTTTTLSSAPTDLEQTQKKTVTTTQIITNENYPYVTTSPKQIIDNTNFLTGDAMGSNVYSGSTFSKILEDAKSADEKIKAKSYEAGAEMNAADKATELSYISKHFSNSAAEFGNLQDGVTTFPLLVVEDTDATQITNLIENYIRVLTNTEYEFAKANSSNVYKVVISRMTYDQQTKSFIKYTDNVCLVNEESKFKPEKNKFDTGDTNQFTLVDVQFLDPSDTNKTKVAYHLYVPVYVKKILTFDFYATLASNTEYYKDAYKLDINRENFAPLTLFENLGNPVTLAFEYRYARSTDEWINLLNGGENVVHKNNFYKSLLIKRHQGTWPGITKLVLVDSTKNGKNYYLDSLGEPPSGSTTYQLNLKSFEDKDGNAYEPSPLNDLMTITTAKDNTNGTLIKLDPTSATYEADKAEATFRDKNGDLFMPKGDKTSGDFYKVTDVTIDSERYYLSIFTQKPKQEDADYNSIFYYEITSKDKFERTDSGSGNDEIDGDNWRPNKYSTAISTAYLLMGNLYVNNFVLSSSSKNDNLLMSRENNYINVKMTSTVKLTDLTLDGGKKLSSIFAGKENDSSIYQTFLMAYDKNEKIEDAIKNSLGIDTSAGTLQSKKVYIVPGEKLPTYFDDYSSENPKGITELTEKTPGRDGYEIIPSNNYIEIRNNQNLVAALADDENSNAITIQVSFNILYDEAGLAKQFPQKGTGSNENIGSAVIGYSNISSTAEGAAYSATSEKRPRSNETIARYYTEGISSATTLKYNMKENTDIPAAERAKVLAQGQYRDLGINAKTDAQGRILSRATYDTHVLTNRNDYDYIELTLTLSEKTSYVKPGKNNPIGSGTALKIDDYLSGLKIYGKNNEVIFDQQTVLEGTDEGAENVSASKNEAGTVYTVRVKKDLIDTQGDAEDGRFIFDYEYNVLTGDGEEKWNKKYSNYKVTVTAQLCKKLNSNTTSDYNNDSFAYDHLIYTNAKINPNVI